MQIVEFLIWKEFVKMFSLFLIHNTHETTLTYFRDDRHCYPPYPIIPDECEDEDDDDNFCDVVMKVVMVIS